MPRVSLSHLDRHLIVLFSGLRELTHNELFQDPKTESCWCTLKRKECISFYYALILIVFITQRVHGHATNDVMTQQEVKCTPNHQCKCTMLNEKQGMLLHEVQKFSFKCTMQSFLYENLTNIHQANLMQVPC